MKLRQVSTHSVSKCFVFCGSRVKFPHFEFVLLWKLRQVSTHLRIVVDEFADKFAHVHCDICLFCSGRLSGELNFLRCLHNHCVLRTCGCFGSTRVIVLDSHNLLNQGEAVLSHSLT